MDFSSVRLITFDCYGTLVNWEAGILAALRPVFARNGRQISDLQLLEQYGEAEAELEAGPYIPYRQVLSRTAQEMARRLGATVSEAESSRFADSLINWQPFPDTVAALQSLAQRFRLGIISNIDDDLFAETKKKLDVEFAVIVTAQQVQSYKPELKNFREALRRSGLKTKEVLHAGQSLYHDVAPANFLGIRNVWVNRPSIRPGSGAAKPGLSRPTLEVSSLAELAKLLTQ